MIKNQWYAILSSRELPGKKLVAVKRCGMDLCLFRLDNGEIGCVVDQCTHRGAAISKGKHHGNCIACPFHGIRFDNHGKTVLIPTNGMAAKPEERFNVKSYLVKEKHQMIYLWYGDEGKVTEEIPFFDDIDESTMIFSEMTDCWHAHYSRCVENQLDVIHVPFVHYNTIGRGNKTIVNGPPVEVDGNKIMFSAYNSVDTGQTPIKASELKVDPHMNLSFIFPNTWQNHITEQIRVVIFFSPIDEEHTMFTIRFYTNQFKVRLFNQLMASVGRYMNRVIERQDKQYVETQRPKKSALLCGENLLRGDSPVMMYRKMRDTMQKESENKQ